MSGTMSLTGRLHLPQDPAFGRMVPKSKIYQHTRASKKLQAAFVEQVEKIIHTSILSSKTVNLPPKGSVKEIHVLTLALRKSDLKPDILGAIDKAIPYPTLLILSYGGKIKYAAAYKRPSEADKKKWVISSHFSGQWIKDNAAPQNLPLALDLLSLYEQLIKRLIPLPSRNGESIDELVTRAESLQSMERQAAQLQSRLENQKQFNRKVELNTLLKALKNEIIELKR